MSHDQAYWEKIRAIMKEYIPPTVKPEVSTVPPGAPFPLKEALPPRVRDLANRPIARRLAMTGGAVKIWEQPIPIRAVLIVADPANPANVWVGDDQVNPQNGFPLGPGVGLTVYVNDPSVVGVVGAPGTFVNFVLEAY